MLTINKEQIAKEYLTLNKKIKKLEKEMSSLSSLLKDNLSDEESIETKSGIIKLISYAQKRLDAKKAREIFGDKLDKCYDQITCKKLIIS